MAEKMKNLSACIMAGGVGSRFWPASRESKPKQFLDITGDGRSMIQVTFDRMAKIVPKDQIFIVTNSRYKELVMEHLPGISDSQILCEPMRRNTAPAALFGTIAAQRSAGSDAVVIMTPADQVIDDEDTFSEIMLAASNYAASNKDLVTIGIKPEYPHTGYGYIKFESGSDKPYQVDSFTEKPNRDRAEMFVNSGNYLWNAGIFIWKAATLYEAYQTHAPEMWEAFQPLLHAFTEEDIYRAFDNVDGESIDYQIMEKADNVVTWPGAFGWSDVGSWKVVHDIADKDENNNLIIGAEAVVKNCKDSLFSLPEGKVVVAKGLEGFIVMDTGDVLVIYPKNDDQELKQIRSEVINSFGTEFE